MFQEQVFLGLLNWNLAGHINRSLYKWPTRSGDLPHPFRTGRPNHPYGGPRHTAGYERPPQKVLKFKQINQINRIATTQTMHPSCYLMDRVSNKVATVTNNGIRESDARVLVCTSLPYYGWNIFEVSTIALMYITSSFT